jgi:hypothetical protein
MRFARIAIESGLAAGDVSASPKAVTTPTNRRETGQRKGASMLYTLAVVLIVLWLLGLVTSYTMGGFIHILLVIAVIMVLLNVINGRRSL